MTIIKNENEEEIRVYDNKNIPLYAKPKEHETTIEIEGKEFTFTRDKWLEFRNYMDLSFE